MTIELKNGVLLEDLPRTYELVKKLRLPVLEEALSCLYHSQKPESQALLDLEEKDWALLLDLLFNLLAEKKQSNLH